jgi:hypothetical protein
MLLEIEEDVFSDQVDDVMAVLTLVQYAVYQRHSWLPAPAVAITASKFLEVNAPTMVSWRDFAMHAAVASVYEPAEPESPAKVAHRVTVTAANAAELATELGLPAVIVVENGRNDGSLLKAVFAAYDPQVLAAVEKHWLKIDHSGGTGDQPWVASEAASRFQHVCRVMILKDNDQRIPRQTTAAEDMAGWTSKEPLVHIWWRHEAENYLPDVVLQLSAHPQAAQLLAHLRALPTEHQGWIDMKKGLQKGPKEIADALTPAGRQVWKAGYGGYLPKPLVPKEVPITVDDFRALGEDVHQELLHLLDKIKRVL